MTRNDVQGLVAVVTDTIAEVLGDFDYVHHTPTRGYVKHGNFHYCVSMSEYGVTVDVLYNRRTVVDITIHPDFAYALESILGELCEYAEG